VSKSPEFRRDKSVLKIP
jgi:hypothetical protein